MKLRFVLKAMLGLTVLLFGSNCLAAVCYVDQNATGKNDGSSWANAYTHPQYALLFGCTEIWVAKGVYTPSGASNDPTMSFNIPAGTKMYGGFAGSETSVDQRLPSLHETVLSGDVDHNDIDPGNWRDKTVEDIAGHNSHHVVSMLTDSTVPITNDTVLDGFFVVGGDSPSTDDVQNGAAVHCTSGEDSAECSPTLSNLFLQAIALTA